MSKVRVCFLGTPDFAVICLKQILADEHYEVVGVVTQPDRPRGRKLQLSPSPVKQLALSNGLQVISPEKINQPMILQEIQKWGAEVAVVVAFGQILSTDFLQLFPYGAVNVHGSILPRWRGAAPIQRALEAGDLESGVTLQKVVKELDAGDIIGIRKMKLDPDVNALQVHDEMARLGANLLHVELMDYVRGNLAPIPQDHSLATYAKKIDKAECEINWNLSAMQIHNKARGFLMGPGTFFMMNGKRIKLHKTKLISLENTSDKQPIGQMQNYQGQEIHVQTGKGVLALLEVQPESKPKMSATDFIKSVGGKL